MTDITFPAGTTRIEAVTLNDNAIPDAPIDLTLCSDIVFVALDANGRLMLRKHLADSSIMVTSEAAGQFSIFFDADDTSPAFGVGSFTETTTYPFELSVYFSDTPHTQELILTGDIILTPRKGWGKGTITAGSDRQVIVQGRY